MVHAERWRRTPSRRQRSFGLREFGSTQQLSGALDTKAHKAWHDPLLADCHNARKCPTDKRHSS
jgi:hypothetical protein